LLDVLEKQWNNLVTRRMYISGGLGSRHDGEALGKDFELPNERAYTETCAAIGSMMWNHRLLAATGQARYADLIEWTLYNGMLPGWGLDGKHYFYVNPLADDGEHHRQEWYDVACCPPNVARTLAELPGYVYSTREDEVWVNLYMQSEAQIPLGDRTVTLSQKCNYPWDGRIDLTVGTAGSFAINVRIPGWCDTGGSVRVNGDAVANPVVPGAYLTIERLWKPGDIIQLDFPMTIRIWQSHPHLHDNAGRIALSRGPVLYCLEGVDHPGGNVQDLVLKGAVPLQAVFEPGLLGGVMVLKGEALRRVPDDAWRNALYRPLTAAKPATAPSQPLQAIPYFVWQNRGASRMSVWLEHDGQCGCAA
jgi:DUF1680 family protein